MANWFLTSLQKEFKQEWECFETKMTSIWENYLLSSLCHSDTSNNSRWGLNLILRMKNTKLLENNHNLGRERFYRQDTGITHYKIKVDNFKLW